LKAKYIKISFPNIQDLLNVRKFILERVEKNSKKFNTEAYEFESYHESNLSSDEEDDDMTVEAQQANSIQIRGSSQVAVMDSIIDAREYDVSYHIRVAIDEGMFQCLILVTHNNNL
jgi:DNA polymerase epsilon subunit 1